MKNPVERFVLPDVQSDTILSELAQLFPEWAINKVAVLCGNPPGYVVRTNWRYAQGHVVMRPGDIIYSNGEVKVSVREE